MIPNLTAVFFLLSGVFIGVGLAVALHKDEIASYVEKKRLERRLRAGRLRGRGHAQAEYDLHPIGGAHKESDDEHEDYPATTTSYYTSGRTSSAAQHFDNADLRRMRLRALDTAHDHESLYSDNISLHTRRSSYSLESEPSLYYDVLPPGGPQSDATTGTSTPFTPSESDLTSELSTVDASDEDDAFVLSDSASIDRNPFVVVRRRQEQAQAQVQ